MTYRYVYIHVHMLIYTMKINISVLAVPSLINVIVISPAVFSSPGETCSNKHGRIVLTNWVINCCKILIFIVFFDEHSLLSGSIECLKICIILCNRYRDSFWRPRICLSSVVKVAQVQARFTMSWINRERKQGIFARGEALIPLISMVSDNRSSCNAFWLLVRANARS